MCGILGVWHTQGKVDPTLLQAAAATQRHRGPDDEGFILLDTVTRAAHPLGGPDTPKEAYGAPHPYAPTLAFDARDAPPADLAFAHRRLSILDLSPAGHQPMCDADRSLWIVHNGEVYNYVELRDELKALGHTFRTGTDTEVLLAAYRQWGVDMLPRLVGMFAFALYDVERRTLLLARDPFGIKPLYYARSGCALAFASTITAVRAALRMPAVANAQAVYDYLVHGATDHDQRTMFEGVLQVMPGHYLLVRDGVAASPTRYAPPASGSATADPARGFREAFLRSVRLHIRSDVPVGAALSGGLDSSSVVAGMRAVEPNARIHAFAFVADDPALNEERYAKLVAERAGATLTSIRLHADDLQRDLDHLVRMLEVPFGSTSIYAQFRVFQEARRAGVIVMLDGQGADELLGGYHWCQSARLADLLRRGRLLRGWRFAKRAPRGVLLPALGRLAPGFAQRPLRAIAGRPLAPRWIRRAWFAKRRVALRPVLGRAGSFRAELADAVERSFLPALLRYEDRNSMAHGVESRVPFLTADLAALLAGVPDELLIGDDATTKKALREGLRGLVPDEILDRKDKIGFATPERAWLEALAPFVDETLASDAAKRIPCFDAEAARAEWRAIRAGEARFDMRVWRWVNLVLWAQAFDVDFDAKEAAA